MATLTLRNTKGSALTFDELDSNFLALDSDITSINNTLSSGVGLGADSVNSLIDARIDSDDFVDLTTVQTITGAKTFNGGITVTNGLTANSLTYPTADGNTGEFLKTDGAGNLTFDEVTSYDSVKVQGQIDSDITNNRGIYIGAYFGPKPAIRVGAFSSDNTVAIGKDVLLNDSASGSYTGYRNVAIGRETMADMTSGHDNVAIGYLALNEQTTANDCVAVGAEAAQKNNAQYTVAIGYRALEENTTGEDNIAMGAFALEDNETGSRNTAIGYSALEEMINQNDNTAVGFRVLEQCQDGSQNTGVGSGALDTTTSGARNTSVGYQSLTANTIGQDNVAVGASAMGVNSTGNENTAVGASAMTNMTSGSNNTAIGYDAEPSSSSISNEVTIGNSNVARFRVPGITLAVDSTNADISRVFRINGTPDPLSTLSGEFLTVKPALRVWNSTGGSGLYLEDANLNTTQLFQVNSGNEFRINRNGTTRLTIDSDGNVILPGQLQSTVSTGTAPFEVASTTLVTNLNADTVDGFNGIAVYDRNGTLLN